MMEKKYLMLRDNFIDKLLDKIKKIIDNGKFDYTNILVDTDISCWVIFF